MSLGFISYLGTSPAYFHHLQYSFPQGLRYFIEYLQWRFQCFSWRVSSSVLGSEFHLGDLLDSIYYLDISFSHLHPVIYL